MPVCLYVCMFYFFLWLCSNVCMHACMHACMYVCMYVCMHACMFACVHVRKLVCVYVCQYVCMCQYGCMCERTCTCLYLSVSWPCERSKSAGKVSQLAAQRARAAGFRRELMADVLTVCRSFVAVPRRCPTRESKWLQRFQNTLTFIIFIHTLRKPFAPQNS